MSISAQFFIKYALEIGALELLPEGRTLKSGRISPYFFNSGRFYEGEAGSQLTNAYVNAFKGEEGEAAGRLEPLFEVVFGPAYKAIPLAVDIRATLFQRYRMNVGYAFNRKEEKDHGEGGIIVGSPLKGKRVLIVDDVITDGASKREAIELIRANGGIPVACVIAFDRQERGIDENDKRSAVQRFESEYHIPVYAAATLSDLLDVLRTSDDPLHQEILPNIQEYALEYSAE